MEDFTEITYRFDNLLHEPAYRAEGHSTSQDVQTPLEYDKLPQGRSIRVLDLACGNWDEPVNCSLRMVHLDNDDPRYEAISYAWGDHTDRKTIVCNGSLISITRSLFEALQRFRHVDTKRTLWADAICINQADNTERTSQVRLMSFIYTRAVRVLVWLQHDDSQVVQKSLNAICRFVLKEDIPWGFQQIYALKESNRTLYRWRDLKVVSLTEEESPDIADRAIDGLRHVCSAPWFGRGWMIQEVALAVSTSFFWGHAEIGFEWLGIALKCVIEDYTYGSSPKMLFGHQLFIIHLNMHYSDKEPKTFLGLIFTISDFTFSDPKDRIYGILGLKTFECDPASGDSFVNPDYSITTTECYRRVTVKLLSEWHDLRVLSCVSHSSALADDRPSWVPDFNSMTGNVFAGPSTRSLENRESENSVDISQTTIGQKPCVEISGFRVDTVDREIKEYLNILEDDSQAPAQLQALLRFLERRYSQQYLASTFANWHQYLPLDSARAANLLSEYRTFMEWDMALNLSPASMLTLYPDDSTSSFEPNASRFFVRCSYDDSHTPFITSTEMLGLGPKILLPGDAVVVLHGASVPFVLRPAGDGLWRLVGGYYLYEVNEGRCHRDWKEKGSVSEKFCIY